jgi:ABC-2 type transport system permease protein
MTPFGASWRKEWLELRRTYRLLILIVVLAVLGLLAPVTAKYTPEFARLLPNGEAIAKLIPKPTAFDAVAQYQKSMSQFGLILAILLAMGAVAQEKDKGTAALMLVKPLPRRSFLLAKFAVLAVAFGLALLVAGLGAYYYTWLLFGPLDPLKWVALNALDLCYLLVPLAITLACSVIARSQAAAGGMAFGLTLLLALLGSLPGIGSWLPSRVLVWASSLPVGNPAPAWGALGLSAALVALVLAGASARLERQEL